MSKHKEVVRRVQLLGIKPEELGQFQNWTTNLASEALALAVAFALAEDKGDEGACVEIGKRIEEVGKRAILGRSQLLRFETPADYLAWLEEIHPKDGGEA